MRARQRRVAVPIAASDLVELTDEFTISFNADGSRFGVVDNERIRVWDSESLAELAVERTPVDEIAAEKNPGQTAR
ncbi:MAG: hypothetical protein ACRDTT_12670 [Pseudonocardiaceae bacterium]